MARLPAKVALAVLTYVDHRLASNPLRLSKPLTGDLSHPVSYTHLDVYKRQGHLRNYICDFPAPELNRHPKVLALPHLGASTAEAEDNCAAMAADELRDFLERGEISNSVNFPNARLPRSEGTTRVVIANSNVPNIVGRVTTMVAESGLNIADMLNASRGDIAVTLVDLDNGVPADLVDRIRGLDGVLSARVV